jgi:hypothetical protein
VLLDAVGEVLVMEEVDFGYLRYRGAEAEVDHLLRLYHLDLPLWHHHILLLGLSPLLLQLLRQPQQPLLVASVRLPFDPMDRKDRGAKRVVNVRQNKRRTRSCHPTMK